MKINLVGECFEMTDNTRIAELPQVPEAKGFDEVVCGYHRLDAMAESLRCLHCDRR